MFMLLAWEINKIFILDIRLRYHHPRRETKTRANKSRPGDCTLKTNKRCLQNSNLIQRYPGIQKWQNHGRYFFSAIYSNNFYYKSCYIIMWFLVTFMPPCDYAKPDSVKTKPNFLRIWSPRPASVPRWAIGKVTVRGEQCLNNEIVYYWEPLDKPNFLSPLLCQGHFCTSWFEWRSIVIKQQPLG